MAVLNSEINTESEVFRTNMAAYSKACSELDRHLSWALGGGGLKMIERHHKRGKILVRDRIDLLVDEGTSFLELSPLAALGLYNNELPSAGIVTGVATIRGTTCMIIANDATVKAGAWFA